MSNLDLIHFRSSYPNVTTASGATSFAIDTGQWRATYSLNAGEDLPGPGSVSPGGLVVDDDYKTHVKYYWQFWRKPKDGDTTFGYNSSLFYVYPDLAWDWPVEKRIIPVTKSSTGQTPPEEQGTFHPSGEIYVTEWGLCWRAIPQTAARTTSHSVTNNYSLYKLGTNPYKYTTYVKFMWGGYYIHNGSNVGQEYPLPENLPPPWNAEPYPSAYNAGLCGGGQWGANANAGGWVCGVLGATFTPNLSGGERFEDQGTFYVITRYGHYDPGPADTQSLFQQFYYPIDSVLKPDKHYWDQELDVNNGDQGKWTFVITCDGYKTSYGMINGHSGGEIEWFGESLPFEYNSGGPSAGDINIAIAKSVYPYPGYYGTNDFGGFLGSTFHTWNGWLVEVVHSAEPYDTYLGELGRLRPTGYTHLDNVFRTFE